MSLKILPALMLPMAAVAGHPELQQVARGMPVRIEPLEGAIGVNGLPITMSRATGPGVPALSEALTSRWRAESGDESVRRFSCCGWTFASRIQSGTSQVIQWRATAAGGELLWSSLRVDAGAPVAPSVEAPLPAHCDWNTPVHGKVADRRFLQLAGRCPWNAQTAFDSMTRRLVAEGWKWQRAGSLVLQAWRGSTQLQVVASSALPAADTTSARSTLVLLETRPAEGVRP